MFNKLDVPVQWKESFTKYPHGYTIFEAICKWTEQVDLMVEHLNFTDSQVKELFTNTLPANIGQVLDSMVANGTLTPLINTSLAQTANRIDSKFLSRLLTGQVTKIKLIGDSITDGNGARNYATPPESNPVILNDGGALYHEPSYTNTSWANKFRNFISASYPSIQFINAAVGGKSAKWANANKALWVSENEDVVFVMLGTNDRWDSASPAAFKADMESFLTYVKDRSNVMIVLTPPPTQNDGNPDYLFGMREVDNVITEICQRKNYTHISAYREMLEYSVRSGATLKTLIEDAGSHPVNEGYEAIWKFIQERLGFTDSTTNWSGSNPSAVHTVIQGDQVPYILFATPITFFEKGKKTVAQLESYSDVANFPEATTGWLTTTRGSENDLNSFQEWEPRESYNKYKRTWNYGANNWNAWKQVNESTPTTAATGLVTTRPMVSGTIVNLLSNKNGAVQVEYAVDITGWVQYEWNHVGTIPVGFRPTREIMIQGLANDFSVVRVRVGTDGVINASTGTVITRVYVTTCYLL